MVDRRLPKVRELAPLMKFLQAESEVQADPAGQGSNRLRPPAIARRRTPKAPFDYTEGAAEPECRWPGPTAFEDVEFHPAILRDVSDVDTSCTSRAARRRCRSASPRPVHPHDAHGGREGRRRCRGRGRHPVLALDRRHGDPRRRRRREPERPQLVPALHVEGPRPIDGRRRPAAAAGFDTLLVTVDVPVAGARLRDRYNGLTIPPTLTGRTVLNAIPRVRWWFDFLTTEPIGFAT